MKCVPQEWRIIVKTIAQLWEYLENDLGWRTIAISLGCGICFKDVGIKEEGVPAKTYDFIGRRNNRVNLLLIREKKDWYDIFETRKRGCSECMTQADVMLH